MKFELKIALRYLKSKGRNQFISFVTFISIAGVAIGVMALIIVLAVMSGFDSNLREKIVGISPHIYIQKTGGIANYIPVIEKLRNIQHIEGISPFIEGQCLLRKKNQVLGVAMRGILSETEPQVTNIKNYLIKGVLPKNKDDILLGSQLAKTFNLRLGDTITAISPVKGSSFKYKLCGIFNSGMYDYDSSLSFVSLASSQDFFKTGNLVGTIGVKCDNLFLAKKVKQDIIKKMGFGYWVETWMGVNKNLFSSLKLEKTVMFIILVLIILVASFNIISTLIMTVMEKTKDIGILESLGATRKSISLIFTYCGLIIGVIGTIIGAAAGFLSCYLLKTYKFIKLPADVYYINTLPVKIQWTDVAIIALSAIAVSYLATLYPAYQAAKLKPVEALRYE